MVLIWTVTGTGGGLDDIVSRASATRRESMLPPLSVSSHTVTSISFTINVTRCLALGVSRLAAVTLDALVRVLNSSKDIPSTPAPRSPTGAHIRQRL
ncbi:hypothetical protein V8B97DRAFT_2009946 [Scleroderma yunnanense]